jgi:hypothetical protein
MFQGDLASSTTQAHDSEVKESNLNESIAAKQAEKKEVSSRSAKSSSRSRSVAGLGACDR